jgi:hypothetical protein
MRETLLAIALLVLAFSCKRQPTEPTPPPPPPLDGLRLEALDASCVESWLRIRVIDGSSPPFEIALLRDSQTVHTFQLSATDSILIDEGLLPNTTYTYHAQRLSGSTVLEITDSVMVTTMDSSSSNWVFDPPVLLGSGSSSVLRDIVIVSADPDSTLVIAVGEVYHSDSSQSFLPFCVVLWDGQTWSLKRLFYNGTNIIAAVRGIWVAGPNDIWLAAGSVFHWDGVSSQAQLSFSRLSLPDPNATIEKLWGSPEVGLFGVGNAGTIVHRDASGTWRRVETGTGLPIRDVFGARDARTGRHEVLCVSADPNIPGRSQVLAIENMTVREVATDPLWEPWGIWFVPGRWYVHAGDGLWETRFPRGTWVRNSVVPAWFKESVRGQGLNDAAVCGAFWLLATWNGVRWQTHFQRTTSAALGGVALKGDLLVAVGFIGNNAVVIQGRR